MLTEKDYCDYDTCVALKELGYPNDWFEDETYHENSTEISLYESQKFLREMWCIHIEILYQPFCWTGKIYDLIKRDYIKGFTFFESFEDALHTLIKEAVKILKENETIHE